MGRKAKNPRAEPVFTISVASRLSRLPVHTIRWLEAHDFVEPWRTRGNQRLFSEADVELLRELAELLQRHVNVAGIRTILEIKRTYRIGTLVIESRLTREG